MADATTLRVEFAGEWFDPVAGEPFTIGREGDLAVDDNPYLHRAFLEITHRDGLWWLTNVGSRLSATLSSAGGVVQSWLSPGASLPLVFAEATIVFTAGPTTYEIGVQTTTAPFAMAATGAAVPLGDATVMPSQLTALQKALIVALAEPMLRRDGVGVSELPTSTKAAERLGWSMSRFNRKLDNVCDKLDRMGVQGLRGGAGRLASNRRARLVEYAVSSQLVTRADLALLDDDALRGTDDEGTDA
ncbi:hypothetical protein GCM10009846_04560 [Agrococcus versicolor]|uniref:FHA domain-containing protein n=1 Tax=Agrococcus versicolor TaxID=501482 RepID=A0ABP5MF12_9MICO